MAEDLLTVRDLAVTYPGQARSALAGCDLTVTSGQTLALVGPSGSGKSTLARALLGLLPRHATWSGEILWQGRPLKVESDWRRVRGGGIGLVLQDPETALNPWLRIGEQVAAPLRRHRRLDRAAARDAARQWLREVGLPEPARLAECHPHELSGGMRQRVALAMALAAAPKLLVADEPTSALDPTTQRDILRLLRRLQRRHRLALVFVTHDLPIVPLVASRIAVLDTGKIVETGASATVLGAPRHTTTRRLLATVPSAPADAGGSKEPVLVARGLSVDVGSGRHRRTVVREVDLAVGPSETLGLAGESGAGKTTLGRALAGLAPASGILVIAGADQGRLGGRARRRARRRTQLVFQDPAAALDPRQRVGRALREAITTGTDATDPEVAVAALLGEVGLDETFAGRFPHELSGGQQRRVVLARALAASPVVLIADEPTSSLDRPAQAQVLGLLRRSQAGRDLALLLISHDLEMLHRTCDRVAVMLAGRLVEVYPVDRDSGPRHPYALELADAAPQRMLELASELDPGLPGEAMARPVATVGCPYHARCPLGELACRRAMPALVETSPGHLLRCPVVT